MMNQKHRMLKSAASGGSVSSIPVLPIPTNRPSLGQVGRRESTGGIFNTPSSTDRSPRSSQQVVPGQPPTGKAGQVQNLNSNEKLLMRKIQELERQNLKLKKHAEEAEGAIRNYRGFLSSRSGGSDSSKNAKPAGVSVQTEITGSVIGALQSNERLADAKREIAKLERLQQVKKASEKQKSFNSPRASEAPAVAVNPKDNLKDQRREEEKSLANLSVLDIAAQDSKVSAMESQITAYKAELAQLRSSMKMHQKSQEDHVGQAMAVENDFMMLKSTYEKDKSEMQKDLYQMKTFLTDVIPSQIQVVTSALEAKEEDNASLRLTLNLRDAQLKEKEIELETRSGEIDGLHLVHKQLAHAKDGLKELEDSIQHKQDTATTTALAVAEVLAKATIDSKTSTTAGTQMSPMKESHHTDNTKETSQVREALEAAEMKMTGLSEEREKYFSKYSSINASFMAISKQFIELEASHTDTCKGVKHAAHVKDLGRIAALRELSLEKDKVASDLQHSKEIQNVLSFCLNTLEQTLLELQPQVVSRMAEGRSKRMNFLTRQHKSTLKDIEQRSAETCAMSTSALESFQIKADTKRDAAIVAWDQTLSSIKAKMEEAKK